MKSGSPFASARSAMTLGGLLLHLAVVEVLDSTWRLDGSAPRHTGHADLLREAVDGRTGEDPPSDWLPPGP